MNVTAIIPAYNAEHYVRDAARSVLDQSYKALELIIVDDGSNDRTRKVAESLTDARVRVLAMENRGRAAARNAGLAAARPSELVAFLDADDLWDGDKLEEQVAYLAAHLDVVAVGSFMRFISSGGRVLGETGQSIDTAAMERMKRAELVPFPISSCLVVRRQVLEFIGGFDPGLREGDDLELLAQLARMGRIACIPRALGSYRVHSESAMAKSQSLVSTYARFVRQRLHARDAGGDLTWDTFSSTHRPTWRDTRRDLVESWHRSATLMSGEGRRLRSHGYTALAAFVAPLHTLRRVWRQRNKV